MIICHSSKRYFILNHTDISGIKEYLNVDSMKGLDFCLPFG